MVPLIPNEEELKPAFPYMEKIIKLSSVINMWPNTKNKNPFFYHLIVWLIIFNGFILFLSFAIQIRNQYQNLDSIAILVDFITVIASGTFRYAYVYFRGEKYLVLVSLAHNNFIHYSLFPKENRLCLTSYYKFTVKMITLYTAFTFFWILQVCTMPMFIYAWKTSNLPASGLNGTEVEFIPYPVPVKSYAPFDYDTQPGNALFYGFQFFGFMMLGYIYMVVDSFWYMIIILTIGQFALLKDSVHTISETLKMDTSTEEFELSTQNQVKNAENGLKHCIRHHQFTRQFVRLMDEINNPIIMIDSLHAAVSIGFILLDLTIALNKGDWNKILYTSEYFITSIAHMFFFNLLAHELAAKEQQLAEALYDIPWYKTPIQKQFTLLIVMQARRPYRLTGGKLYKLSLEFFTSLMKTVFSYFTFLIQLRDGRPGK